MKFDFNEVVANMLQAVKDVTKETWEDVKQTCGSYFEERKLRLDLLATLMISKEIEKEFFLKRLADEKKIFESELHSVAIVTKATAQKAANAAADVLETAVFRAIGLR